MWPLNVCQIGKETTPGTAVAATTIWRAPFGGWDDDRQTETIEEDVGTFGNSGRIVETMQGVKVPMQQGALHFEQLLYLLEGSIGIATPSGAGPYTRDYVAPIGDTPPTLRTHTLRIGNKTITSDVAIVPFALPMEWEISGNQGELWKVSGTWMAPRKTTGSFTAGLSLPAWEPATFGKTTLFIDDSGGTVGTTQKLGVLMGFTLKYSPQIEWVPVGDGNLYASAYKIGKPLITFSLTLELQQDTGISVVNVERGHYEAFDFRLIRLVTTGAASRQLTIDLCGQYTKIGQYSKNGQNNTVVTFEGEAKYNATDAFIANFEVITNLATIT
jgi:hypothetical protein